MFSCAVTWHGALYTWGCGSRGQLGTGSLQDSMIAYLFFCKRNGWKDSSQKSVYLCHNPLVMLNLSNYYEF